MNTKNTPVNRTNAAIDFKALYFSKIYIGELQTILNTLRSARSVKQPRMLRTLEDWAAKVDEEERVKFLELLNSLLQVIQKSSNGLDGKGG